MTGYLVFCLLGTPVAACSPTSYEARLSGPYAFDTLAQCREVMSGLVGGSGLIQRGDAIEPKELYLTIYCGDGRL